MPKYSFDDKRKTVTIERDGGQKISLTSRRWHYYWKDNQGHKGRGDLKTLQAALDINLPEYDYFAEKI